MKSILSEIPADCFLLWRRPPDSLWLTVPVDELRDLVEYQSAKALAMAAACGVPVDKECPCST